jgi:hypothetical protein
MLDNPLVRDSLKLIWCINEASPDLISELDCREKVASTEAKTHGHFGRSAVITALGRKSNEDESYRIEIVW